MENKAVGNKIANTQGNVRVNGSSQDSVIITDHDNQIAMTSFGQQALKLQDAVNQEVNRCISELKGMGEPIYYSRQGRLIREEADGRKFEYRPLLDGSEELLGEVED